MARKMSGATTPPWRLLITAAQFNRKKRALALAAAVCLGLSPSLTACGSSGNGTADKYGQCVEKVNPNDGDDNVNVRVVDRRMCDDDEYRRSHGGNAFIATGGGSSYSNGPVGSTFVHSTGIGGGDPLIRSTDTAARANAGVARGSFNPGQSTGKSVTVKSGGVGGGAKGGSVGGNSGGGGAKGGSAGG